MIADGLWRDRRHRLSSPHQPRRRRDCLGELVQIDGSEHAWFEDRGAPCTLLGFVDDATSRLMQLRFVTSESAFDYFRTTRAYLEEHGKPVAFYSDKHGIFRVNRKEAAGGDGVTQFGRALLTSTSSVPTARRQRDASNARLARCRTAWSRACPRESGGAAAGGGIPGSSPRTDCRGERMAARVYHRLQHALRPRPGQCQGSASAAGTSR